MGLSLCAVLCFSFCKFTSRCQGLHMLFGNERQVGKHPWLWVIGFGLTFFFTLLTGISASPSQHHPRLPSPCPGTLSPTAHSPLTGLFPVLFFWCLALWLCFIYFPGASLNSSFTFPLWILIPAHHHYQNEQWKVPESIAKRPWQLQITTFPSTPGFFKKK